jgi:branched-chain amino acid transport system substrate-binding protein
MRKALLGFCLSAYVVSSAASADTIKIGIIGPFSGPFATSGVQFKQGVGTYVALQGTKVGNHEIELIYRDTGGTNPAVAKQLAEELVVKEKVNMFGGFYLSPEALAAAPVITEAKTPAVLFVSGARRLTKLSPYFVRAGSSVRQEFVPPAQWAIKQGKRRAYIAVGDYAPGYDAQQAFKATFTSLGGTVVAEDRIPLNTVDFAPFAERIANADIDVVDVFVPPGAPAVGFVKALATRGLLKKTMVIGCAETDEPDLHLFDDSIIGYYSSLYYVYGLPHKENVEFKAALQKSFPGAVANYSMVDAYDGMNLLYRMAAAQNGGQFDPETAMRAVRGYSWISPRGPLTIDPDTREITLNMYIRRVEKVDGKLENVLVDTIPAVKEPVD